MAAQTAPGELDDVVPPRVVLLASAYDDARAADGPTRALDVVASAIALLLLSPLLAAVAALLLIDDGRPVFYRGRRVGRNGRVFDMVKFRTLRRDAEVRMGSIYGADLTSATLGEQTRVGRFLRGTHLDELPQLWNVVRGEMSLVGPRPVRPAFFAQLAEEWPESWQRLVARPGLTGLAQLRMTRETTWAEKLNHDLEWVADRSVRLYVTAVATTAWRVVTRPLTGRPGAVPRAD